MKPNTHGRKPARLAPTGAASSSPSLSEAGELAQLRQRAEEVEAYLKANDLPIVPGSLPFQVLMRDGVPH